MTRNSSLVRSGGRTSRWTLSPVKRKLRRSLKGALVVPRIVLGDVPTSLKAFPIGYTQAGAATRRRAGQIRSPIAGQTLGEGVYGRVEFLGKGKVKKIFKPHWGWKPWHEGEHLWAKVVKQRSFKPKHALHISATTGGRNVRMPYYKGITLYNAWKAGVLEKRMIPVMLRDLLQQIAEISWMHFEMDDTHLNNIMIDPKTGHAKFIDYGLYKYRPNKAPMALYRLNTRKVMQRGLRHILAANAAQKAKLSIK